MVYFSPHCGRNSAYGYSVCQSECLVLGRTDSSCFPCVVVHAVVRPRCILALVLAFGLYWLVFYVTGCYCSTERMVGLFGTPLGSRFRGSVLPVAICDGFGVQYHSYILCQQLFRKFAAVLCICSLRTLLLVCRLQELPWQKPFLMLHWSEYAADVFLLQSGDIVDCSCDREWMGDECLCLVGGSGLLGLPAVGCAG